MKNTNVFAKNLIFKIITLFFAFTTVHNTAATPVILVELDPDNYYAVAKTYIYADGQVLAQHDGGVTADKYFYLHDRLGSVRLIIDDSADVVNHYTYDPFGLLFDTEYTENLTNPFRFAGYWWDEQLAQYYCIARYYDPSLQRFTARDPVLGSFTEPLTLHAYLYCLNDPVNRWDPDGEYSMGEVMTGVGIALNLGSMVYNSYAMYANCRQGDYGAALENMGWFMLDFASWGVATKIKGGFQIANAAATNLGILARLGITVNTNVVAIGGYMAGIGQLANAMAAAEGVSGSGTKPQLHHGISKRIYKALQKNPLLKGKFEYRDPRFVTWSNDYASHKGYQDWHRTLDDEIVQWIKNNEHATPEQFELFLRQRYSQPDLIERFPNGFLGDG